MHHSDKKGQKVIIAFLTIITYLIENCKKKVEKFFADDALLWWTPTNCILTFEPLPYIPLNNVLKTFLKYSTIFVSLNRETPKVQLIRTLRLGHKVLRNLNCRFDRYYIGQIYSGDFAKFFGLLRIYEL